MSYTIKLEQGKYLIRNDNGSLTILRHGVDWPAAEDLKHVGIVLALAQRIEALETVVRTFLDTTFDDQDVHGQLLEVLDQ